VSAVRVGNIQDAAVHCCFIAVAAPTMSLRVTIAGVDWLLYAPQIRLALPASRPYHACGCLIGSVRFGIADYPSDQYDETIFINGTVLIPVFR